MANIRVNKIEAARRQIDVAIKLLFGNEDPIAIHTLASAAFRILRDISNKKTDSKMKQCLKAIIRPNMEKEFWNKMNKPANFFKHADKDHDAILDNVDEKINDSMLVMACLYYKDLGYQCTVEMRVLLSWYTAIYPDFFKDNKYLANISTNQPNSLRYESRIKQIDFGYQLLQRVRTLAKSGAP